MSSTYYHEGYKDGAEGREFNPPAPIALAAEYRAGFDTGRNLALFPDLAGTADDSAEVQAEALTAEFSTPLTRHNRRRKLRAQSIGATLWQDPEQVDLFST